MAMLLALPFSIYPANICIPVSQFIYALCLHLYGLVLRLLSPVHPKAKQWIDGRQNLFEVLSTFKQQEPRSIIWMHCASLGEYEQGRPVLEACKKQFPECALVLSFFSPSGYEIRKHSTIADAVFYLPLDIKQQASRWLDTLEPSIAIFVKYDFWYHYLMQLKKRSIPSYLISALFRPQQLFFKFYGRFFKEMLHSFEHIFVQDNASAALLDSIQLKQHTVAGDTRIDRVLNARATAKSYPIVQYFACDKQLIVGGSTWLKDEQLLASFMAVNTSFKLVVAPHEIDTKHLTQIVQMFQDSQPVLYSNAELNDTLSTSRVLIIDNIGMLNTLYSYASIAYIGGGFGKGIHNVLEAMVYKIPVVFGPNYFKFREARDLINLEVAFSIKNKEQLEMILQKLPTKHQNPTLSELIETYLETNRGATSMITKSLQKHFKE